MLKDLIGVILGAVVTVLLIDFGGFILWSMSGQFPPDSVFIGAISKYILSLFI